MDEPHHTPTFAEIIELLRLFIFSNRNSLKAERRWLAQRLEEIKDTIYIVGAGNLDPGLRSLVNEFRINEIAKEKQNKMNDIAVLDREAQKLIKSMEPSK